MVTDRLLVPIGMNDTRISLTTDMESRLAIGHSVGGDPVSNWDIPTLAGAGALRSTAEDMLTFLAANLSADATSISGVIATTHGERRSAGNNMTIGLGWHRLATANGGVTIWHNGGTGGYRTFAGFDPARQIGVVVLHNSARSADDIGFHLLDPAFSLAAAPTAQIETTVDPAILERYVGTYELAPTFSLTMRVEDGQLMVQATNQPEFPVFPKSDTVFFYKAVEAELHFEIDADGTATGVVLHQGGRELPGRKTR